MNYFLDNKFAFRVNDEIAIIGFCKHTKHFVIKTLKVKNKSEIDNEFDYEFISNVNDEHYNYFYMSVIDKQLFHLIENDGYKKALRNILQQFSQAKAKRTIEFANRSFSEEKWVEKVFGIKNISKFNDKLIEEFTNLVEREKNIKEKGN